MLSRAGLLVACLPLIVPLVLSLLNLISTRSPAMTSLEHADPSSALLWVMAEPGERVPAHDFNEWYDTEHVPLRLEHIPEFLTAARYTATDSLQPSYSAFYQIQYFELFAQPAYTKLRANRSPREADIVANLRSLDRRTCSLLYDSGYPPGSLTANNTANYTVTLTVTLADQAAANDLDHWFNKEGYRRFSRSSGWRRTTRWKVEDSLITGYAQKPISNSDLVYIAYFEFDQLSYQSELKAMSDSLLPYKNFKSVETRSWQLYRAWDNTAPKPRLPYAYPSRNQSIAADKIRDRRHPRALTPLDGMLLNAPDIAEGWNSLLAAVRTKTSLPDDVRELMILRVAALNRAHFEWIHHVHVAEKAGLSIEQLALIRDTTFNPTSPSSLSPLHAAALEFADASTQTITVSDKVFERLQQALQPVATQNRVKIAQLMSEAAAVVATYNMVSRFLVSTDVGNLSRATLPYPSAIAEEIQISISPDSFVHVNVYRSAQKSSSKPWVLTINSLLTDSTMWDGLVARMSPNYNIITYDQRGHGKSSVPPRPCTLEELADDVLTIISHVKLSTPLHAIIGVSQGGATALNVAIKQPHISSHYIICDTQPTTPAANIAAWDERIALAQTQGMDALAESTVARWFPHGSPFVRGPKARIIRDMIINTPIEGFIAGARALQSYDVKPQLVEALQNKKILFMAGEYDGKLPLVMQTLAKDLKSQGVEDVEYVEIQGAGHLPMLDDLDQWVGAVEKFWANSV